MLCQFSPFTRVSHPPVSRGLVRAGLVVPPSPSLRGEDVVEQPAGVVHEGKKIIDFRDSTRTMADHERVQRTVDQAGGGGSPTDHSPSGKSGVD